MPIEFLAYGTVALLLFMMLHFAAARKHYQNTSVIIAFLSCVAAYLLIDQFHPGAYRVGYVLLVPVLLLPVTFWLTARALFDDQFSIQLRHIAIALAVLITQYTLFLMRASTSHEGELAILLQFLPQAISFIFVVLALLTAYRDRSGDLIASRARFRPQFIAIASVLIAATLFAEISMQEQGSPEILETLQKTAIFVITFYAAWMLTNLSPGFLLKASTPDQKTNWQDEPALLKLKTLIEDQNIHQQEGLTIGELANRMAMKEYKLRRMINSGLGFRNFNDFLNRYRVQDACDILIDPDRSDLTVLEIAYKLGYQSIGPFNAAFRHLTGMTPTQYRKKHLHSPGNPS